VASGYASAPITPEVRSPAAVERVRAIGPNLAEWVFGAERVRVPLADLVRTTQFSDNQATAPATPATAKARS
jgi:hypothetical protein